MRVLKIVVSLVFVAAVAFFAARGCAKKETRSPRFELGGPAVKKVSVRKAPKKTAPNLSPTVPTRAKMAVILDDWGHNAALLDKVIELKRPITIAVLPNLEHSRDIAEKAHKNGLTVMLHMPMQPFSDKMDLEKETILTTTPDADIRRMLDRALASIPHVSGVNNHMGSAATSNMRVMRVVLSHLKKKNLFFVDSHVSAKTVGPAVAHETGIRFGKRDVFVDNIAEVSEVRKELDRAKTLALEEGSVIVIGHDKSPTLIALQKAIPEFEKEGVRLVSAKELVAAA